jgi:site-specific DNA-methyltransferase (adenine-specific)
MPKPYYNRNGHTLYLDDCMSVLPQLPAKSVDLIVTDPPYGGMFRSNFGKNFPHMKNDDDLRFIRECIDEACYVLQPHRHVYVFGDDKNVMPEIFSSVIEIIWDKAQLGMGNLRSPYSKSHECIYFGSYVPSRANRKGGKGNLSARMRQGSVITVKRKNSKANWNHPTEKPVSLLRQLIESSSLLGETVLDPFVGVGSTQVAAILEGRKSIGIEIEEKYAEIAADRIDTALDIMQDVASYIK